MLHSSSKFYVEITFLCRCRCGFEFCYLCGTHWRQCKCPLFPEAADLLINPVFPFQLPQLDLLPNFVSRDILPERPLEPAWIKLVHRETEQAPERQTQRGAEIIAESTTLRDMQTTGRNVEQTARREATGNAPGAARPNAEVLAELEAEWKVEFDARKALRKTH
ncbi:hypothetical protein MMC29_007731 [Sticta canariensis]|nr:hypothetical protein [Sticta canariensis]